MDEGQHQISIGITDSTETVPHTRDENRSPTSGSSSEAYAEESRDRRNHRNRKPNSTSRAKRKRKWKPYHELSWDEKRVHDDRETRRAYAKRERLSAEGHPIAPYNTTQFLMDDRGAQQQSRKKSALVSHSGGLSPAANDAMIKSNISSKIITIPDGEKDYSSVKESYGSNNNDAGGVDIEKSTDNNKSGSSSCNQTTTTTTQLKPTANDGSAKTLSGESTENCLKNQQSHQLLNQKHLQVENITDSPIITIDTPSGEKLSGNSVVENSQNEEDIQKYIMDDFSSTYADIHAEQLQLMSKADLVVECLKLERKVDSLERRVKDCRRKHKYDNNKGKMDIHLSGKINQLQVLSAQAQSDKGNVDKPVSAVPVSDHGACI